MCHQTHPWGRAHRPIKWIEQAGASSVQAGANAGIAQLVERNLAKVEVASSSLVSRSKFHEKGSPGFPFLSAVLRLRCRHSFEGRANLHPYSVAR